jgi:hypothetical protein
MVLRPARLLTKQESIAAGRVQSKDVLVAPNTKARVCVGQSDMYWRASSPHSEELSTLLGTRPSKYIEMRCQDDLSPSRCAHGNRGMVIAASLHSADPCGRRIKFPLVLFDRALPTLAQSRFTQVGVFALARLQRWHYPHRRIQ